MKRVATTSQRRRLIVNPPIVGGVSEKFFRDLCSKTSTPLAVKALMLLEQRDFHSLVSLEFDTDWYSVQYFLRRKTLLEVGLDYQIASFFKKRVDLDLGVDREQVAFQKWLAAEQRCKETNERFRLRWDGKVTSSVSVEHVLSRARQKITSILGRFDASKVREHARFGPGADRSTVGNNTSWYDKYRTPGCITPWLREYACRLFSEDGYDIREALIREAEPRCESRLAFVPKNAKTDRSIGVEPRWNIYVQLGIGELIAERLRRCHIDIRDQTRNQDLARRAWVDRLATIDLSSASDCISKTLVVDMLSDADPRWLESILKSRTPYTVYKGKPILLEKISSMGNGYTFPLETLLFFALASAACEVSDVEPFRASRCCSVYGDDIIVPEEAASLLLEVLEVCGFIPNRDKTFTTGYFFESCGTDFFYGNNIRPIFLTEDPSDTFTAITFANQISELALRFSGRQNDDDNPRFANREIWNLRQVVIRMIPKEFRFFGPPEAGDGVIHASFDVATPSIRRDSKNRGWDGFWVKCLKVRTQVIPGYDFWGHLYSKLSGVTDSGLYVSRRGCSEYVVQNVYVLTYTDTLLV